MSVASEINRIKANIADAYDEAEAKGATMPLTENSDNLADTIASIPSGSGDSQFAGLVQRTITTVSDSNATSIGNYAFYNYTNLTSVDFPNTTVIGIYAFYTCTNLTSVDFPNVTSIGAGAFDGCLRLTSIDFPNVTSIGAFAFQNCTSLTSIDFPNVTSIGRYVFNNCTKLFTIILHKRATLENTNAIPTQTIVYVENADLEWYSTAANWSTIYAGGRIKSIDELPE